jgi:hypothetical protein
MTLALPSKTRAVLQATVAGVLARDESELQRRVIV